MGDDGSSLREETRAVQGHVLELLLGVLVVSLLLGLTISLAASLIFQNASQQLVILITIVCGAVGLLAIAGFAFHILTTIKEFRQDIEIAVPFLATRRDIEVLQIRYYENSTKLLHDALAKRPAQERERIAQILQSIQGTNVFAHPEIALFALELMQFLFAIQVARNSERLLGTQASFHKSREVMELQSTITPHQWQEIASQVPNNPYLQSTSPGVPQNILLPDGVKLYLSDIAQELASKEPSSNRSQKVVSREITLLKATKGRNTALRIAAITPLSDYGLPKPNKPRLGLTARCILRNAQDRRVHDLAYEEEQAAAQLNDDGQALQQVNQGQPDLVEHYTSVNRKLYAGNQKPYLLRAYIRIDATFRINQFISFGEKKKQKYRLYAWGKELSHLLSQMDIEEFMATLKDDGQKTPHRIF